MFSAYTFGQRKIIKTFSKEGKTSTYYPSEEFCLLDSSLFTYHTYARQWGNVSAYGYYNINRNNITLNYVKIFIDTSSILEKRFRMITIVMPISFKIQKNRQGIYYQSDRWVENKSSNWCFLDYGDKDISYFLNSLIKYFYKKRLWIIIDKTQRFNIMECLPSPNPYNSVAQIIWGI